MPPTYLSFDDTDSLDGMCTTYLATIIIQELSSYDLIGLPRLVRLNPNIPWKTRGNAAIALAFGRGQGRRVKVGEIGGRDIQAYLEGRPADMTDLLSRARAIIADNAHMTCERTNPGLVVAPRRPAVRLYWRAVREIVDIEEAERAVAETGGAVSKFKNGRGIIGAAAAMAWRPRDLTFEVLTYRSPERVGSRREIDDASVAEMDREIRTTFHNIDRGSGHLAIAPGSPCPVLFGIRGDDPVDLLRAKDRIVSEPMERWLLFLTNQGTDDHIVRRAVSDIRPRQGVILRARVTSRARTIPGGHTFFQVADRSGSVVCAVYEKGGPIRTAARGLLPGDRVEIYGSVREEPVEVNVEKMKVLSLATSSVKVENPTCPACGRHMKSAGREAGYRCRACGVRAPPGTEKRRLRANPAPGWYEPPVSSRRHLYKPTSRIDIGRSPLREIIYTRLWHETSGLRSET